MHLSISFAQHKLFTNQNYQNVKELYNKQLKISWI
jgi:hypothetical protein